MRPHARTTANPTEINAGERISRGAKQVHKKRKQELPHDEQESFTDLAQRKRKRIKNEPIVCVCIAYQEGLMQKGQIELCLQTMESISCCLHDHNLFFLLTESPPAVGIAPQFSPMHTKGRTMMH